MHASVAGKQCHILLHGSVAVMQSIYIYTLYASVAGKQTILACMLALLTSSAISACMPALLAIKLYWLVCQRC